MNDIELKQAWKKLELDKDKLNLQSPNLEMNMELEINKFEKRVNHRDRKEIYTAGGLILLFTVIAIINKGYMRIGSILLIVYFIWVIYYLTKAKARKPIFSISKSIKDQLIEYKSYVVLQRNLVSNVLYWYILPVIPGLVLFSLSFDSPISIAGAWLIHILVLSYVYRLNKRAAKENYDFLLKRLNQAIINLETQT